MNLWRWLGAGMLVVGAIAMLSAQSYVLAGGDKGKAEPGKDAKAEPKKDDGKKDEAKKDDGKKAEAPKQDAKQPAPGGSNVLKLLSIDGKRAPFYQEMTTSTKQTMTVMGQQIVQDQEQTFYILWTPQDKDAAGNYVVKQKITGMKMKIEIGGNKITLDTTAGEKNMPKSPMTDFFNALLKQELTFTVSPELKVVDIKGRDEFVKALGETNPQMNQLLNLILSKEALTNMAEPTWWALPTTGVEKGATWSKDSKLDLGPIGAYQLNYKFTYDGVDAASKNDKIKIDSSLTYMAPSADKRAGLPFAIKSANLKSTNGTGEALFNRDKGRFESSNVKVGLEGKLSIDIGNMETEISLKQDQTTVVRTSDQPFVAAAAAEPAKK